MKVEEFVGSCEAAQILGKTPDTVRLWARKGTLKAVFVTRHGRIFRRRDVEELAHRVLRQRAENAQAKPSSGGGE